MITLTLVIVFIAICIVFNILLPLIAFLTTSTPESMWSGFQAGGWDRAINYLFNGTYWDRWLLLIAGGIAILLFVLTFLYRIFKGKLFTAIFSCVSFFLYLLVIYLYAAWKNPEVFQIWQRVLIYISVILYPLGLLSKSSKN